MPSPPHHWLVSTGGKSPADGLRLPVSRRRLHKLPCPFLGEGSEVVQSRELWELCHLLPAQTYVRRCLHMYAYAMLPKRTEPTNLAWIMHSSPQPALVRYRLVAVRYIAKVRINDTEQYDSMNSRYNGA